MNAAIDDIDAHMGAAGAIERAAILPAIFFAWCANLGLLAAEVVREFEREVLNLRYRDLKPGEFFIKVTGGRLDAHLLNERGRLFAQDHYADYPREFAQALGIAPADVYSAADSWDTYDAVAKPLTAAYYAFADAGHKPHRARRHWWQLWREE
ncbi:MAG: hypothetical protein HC809_00385 [Gammaproteobacteria bacterium]|nr:hypothetical protein [Gammaproteobacteria bacterium]